MRTFKWDQHYDTGFKPIDNQHKSILRLINRVVANRHRRKKILVSLLDELLCYIQYHFKSEENYMLMFGYPEHDTHMIEHAILMKDIIGIIEKYKKNLIGIKALADSLVKWAMPHILEVDKIVGKFLVKAQDE